MTEKIDSDHDSEEIERLEAIDQRLSKTEKLIKENQYNFFTAIRIFIQDFRDYKNGKREFPESALYGLITAYFRPRMVLVIGAVASGIFGALQIWILVNQNRIIRKQSEIMEVQTSVMEEDTWSNKAATITGLISILNNPNDTTKVDLILPFTWLLRGQEEMFIESLQNQKPSYLSLSAWDYDFSQMNSIQLDTVDVVNKVSQHILDFSTYAIDHNLEYDKYYKLLSSFLPISINDDSLKSTYKNRLLWPATSKGADFLDLFRRYHVSFYTRELYSFHTANNKDTGVGVVASSFRPLYSELTDCLPFIIPGFSPNSNDIDYHIAERISKYLVSGLDIQWSKDSLTVLRNDPLNDGFDQILKERMIDLKNMVLNVSLDSLRVNTNLVDAFLRTQ